MGDISEYRGLIFCGTFVLIAVFLITIIPSGFVTSYEDPDRFPEIPEYMEVSDWIAYNGSLTINWENLTYVSGGFIPYYQYPFGKTEFGHDLRLRMVNATSHYILLDHGDYIFGIFFNPWHQMNWINTDNKIDRGTNLMIDELKEDMGSLSFATYKIQCQDFFAHTTVGYNQTAYPDLEDAWDNNAMSIVFGIDWDQKGTTFDAFSIVAKLLSFQANITGNIWLDTMIRIPLMIAMIYIGFILVLRAIGAIFGGGS